MRYEKVMVERDPMEKVPVIVPLHEVKVLEAVHGRQNIHHIETINVDRELPKLDEEYARLEQKYGNHPDMGISWAEYALQGRIDPKGLKDVKNPGPASDEDEDEDNDKNDALPRTNPERKAWLEARGVEIPQGANKDVLIALIEQELENETSGE